MARDCTATGNPLPDIASLAADARFLTRFWAKVKFSRSGCLIWTAAKNSDGYGLISIGRQTVRAHRVAYALTNGEWPDHAAMLLHSCDNPACVNPAHLEEGDAHRNNTQMYERQRRGKKSGAHMWHPSGRGLEGMSRGGSALSPHDVQEIRRRIRPDDNGKVDHFEAALVALDVTGGDVTAETVQRVATGQTFAWVP